MQTVFIGTVFVFGLAIGSFLNVVSIRLPKGEHIGGRSRCGSCKKQLRWFELLPVVSFLFQKGRCRSCGVVLSFQYPVIELCVALVYGIVFLALFPYFSPNILLFALVLIFSYSIAAIGIAIIAADMRYQIIPDGLTIALLITAIVSLFVRAYYPLFHPDSVAGMGFHTSLLHWLFWRSILIDLAGAAGCMLFLFCLWYFSSGKWMGFGDVKLIFATSLLVGFPASIPALLFSFWTGALVGIVFLCLNRKNLQSRIPFGPFILLGTALAYFFSDRLLLLVMRGV